MTNTKDSNEDSRKELERYNLITQYYFDHPYRIGSKKNSEYFGKVVNLQKALEKDLKDMENYFKNVGKTRINK